MSARTRIRAKIDQYVTEADEAIDTDAAILLALADGLEEALTIIEDEEQS
jgi:hypothetical protein